MAHAERLSWRHATKGDREALQKFQCAQPLGRSMFGPRRRRGVRGPDFEAQSAVRTLPLGKSHVLLGFEDDGALAAVVAFTVSWADCTAFLQLVARDNRCHGRHVGDEAMRAFEAELLDLGAQRRGVDELHVECKVQPSNDPSLKLLSRFRWGYSGKSDDMHQIWAATIPMPPAD